MRHGWLVVVLALVWAISWPVIKVGIATVPPLWFGCFRYAIATACLVGLVAARGQLAVPPRADWPLVAISGALQMAAYSALTALALVVVPPGRASVLAYSTPIWVAPLAAWKLRERPSRRAALGGILGIAGVIAIAAPALRADATAPLVAYAMLLAAAGAWAISITAVRAHRFVATPLALAPWQTLVATVLLLPVALAVDGAPPSLTARGAASLAYVGPIATAFAYWAVVEAGRRVRANTLAIGLLATPSLGVLISALTLGEPIGGALVAGIALIAIGICLAR